MADVAAISHRVDRHSRLGWVYIKDMRVSPVAQRKFNKAQAEEYAADFHLEALGYPVASHRDGIYFIVDGQHRVAALRMIGWGDQMIQCEIYEDLVEAEEAELFLERNNSRTVAPFEKFRVAITAGRETECNIQRTVEAQGIHIARASRDGVTSAVSALTRVYELGGPLVLGRTLRILRDSYGASSLSLRAEIITGMGLVCQRYNGDFHDEAAVAKLRKMTGGVGALIQKARIEQERVGRPRTECVAAVIVEVVNSGRGGGKLERWWKAPDKVVIVDERTA